MEKHLLKILLVFLFACSKKNAEPEKIAELNLPNGWSEKRIDKYDDFSDIIFFGNTGYCTGKWNLYRSVDGGDNWQKVLTKSREAGFLNIGMGSSQNTIAVAHLTNETETRIFSTRDGGNSFDSVDIDDHITDISFVNSTTAFMVGNHFWKTDDGGITYTKLFTFSNQHKLEYFSMHFIDDKQGFVKTKENLYTTNDGGHNWSIIPYEFTTDGPYQGSVYFYDANNGFLTTYSHIARYDSAAAAMQLNYTFSHTSYGALHFVSRDTGYVTNGHKILKTTDRGNSWNMLLQSSGLLFDLYFTDPDHGWACGLQGTILKYVKP